jgi:sulfate adenylyltransferase subunit 1 (EFTu-like GTPase family)
MTSTISEVELFDQKITEALPPISVTVHLDDVDVSRGDMIARPKNVTGRAVVKDIQYRLTSTVRTATGTPRSSVSTRSAASSCSASRTRRTGSPARSS